MLPEDLIRIGGETGQPCISLIVPVLQPLPEEKKADSQMLQDAIQKVGDFLKEMYPASLVEKLLVSLRQLKETLDKDNNPAITGVGLYVSPDRHACFSFPFPVQEKISISNAFEIRELLFLQHYAIDYFLLEINGKKISLYKGGLNKLEEIKDEHFPRHFHDDYEYSKPARGLSSTGNSVVQSFEKDKSTMIADRLKHFYREADEWLASYVGKSPLVVAGPTKDLALLEEISSHNKNTIGAIKGNYTHTTLQQLADKAWALVHKWIDDQEHKDILELIQQTGRRLVVEGIKNVWKAANEGRGLKLLVEKDFARPAFIDAKDRLFLKPPKVKHRITIDIIDDIMKKVVEKNGEVKFVKEGVLLEQQHIALITRY
ncbi:baeRF3 domain-containing protein [Chitinophaga vietnamensis]|uniref:baeRF3 domain-containing protein n=1 Tax=Chitinophaga vietnamensis TaxID=2593957 RepID=UPI00117760C1|nr:hypothetical protein [Chitinophaga vietnamensis]